MIAQEKYEIAYAGMAMGQSVMEFNFTSALFVDCPESGIESGQGAVKLAITRHASMLEITASIVGTVEIECDRCADPYTQPINFSGSVIVKISEEEGEYDGDIIWISPRTKVLDLTEWVYESIILSLPFQRTHSSIESCNAEALKYIQIETILDK